MTGRDAILESASRWVFACLAVVTLTLPLLITSPLGLSLIHISEPTRPY